MFDPSAQYELSVCPRGRRPADEYYHQGQVWIEGREGSNYTLRFHNRSGSRVLVIFSVDGLDVLKGQPAGHLSEGYVVNANSWIDVPGWKVDDKTAAEFFFSKAGKSYVTKMGQNASNTGVIGAMVFTEAPRWTVPATYTYTTTTTQLPFNGLPTAGQWANTQFTPTSAGAINVSSVGGFNLNNLAVGSAAADASGAPYRSAGIAQNMIQPSVGTGFGQATEWNTVNTTFTRSNPTVPNAIMPIYYDSARGLQRRGIALKSRYGTDTSNNPFPAYTSSSGATPPPGWKP